MMVIPQGWEIKQISDFAKVMGGKRLPEGANYVIEKTQHPYIRVTDFLERTISLADLKYIDEETHLKVKRYIISKDDVYISIAGTVGISGVIPESLHNANLTENAAKICEIKNVDKDFLSFQINSEHVQQEIMTYIGAAVQPKLALFRIEKLKINVPPFPEQQKIAEILSGIDCAIEATQTLIDKEKMIKKGLMADLLHHGIDEEGRIRTPQTHRYIESPLGMIPEGWEVKCLGELGEFKNGINKSKEDFGFGVPFVNLQDIFGKWRISSDNFDLVNADENEIKNYNLLSGDVLFVRSSVKASGVGLTSLVNEDMDSTVYSGFIIRFRSKSDVYATLYKQYCFHEELFRQRLLQKATVSANSNINQESLSSLLVSLPSIPEQERIASILSAQDRKIETEEANLTKLRHLKKGLMGDLLSGKVRVKG